jgi:hypothetical protein
LPGGSHRQRQPGDGAIGVDGDPSASDEAQSNYRYGMEGFMRRRNGGSLAGAQTSRPDIATKPTSTAACAAFLTPYRCRQAATRRRRFAFTNMLALTPPEEA